MEFILSKIISRAPRADHSDCDITIADKNDCINLPSNTAAENTIYHHIDNGFNDDNIDTVNTVCPKQKFNCVFCFYFYLKYN